MEQQRKENTHNVKPIGKRTIAQVKDLFEIWLVQLIQLQIFIQTKVSIDLLLTKAFMFLCLAIFLPFRIETKRKIMRQLLQHSKELPTFDISF